MTNPTLQAELELILANAMITAQVEPWNDGRTLTTALKATLTIISKHLPEKLEPKNLHLTYDNGGFMGNYCDTCKIFTFDKDTFEETGAWCLCYPRNAAITEMEKILGGKL